MLIMRYKNDDNIIRVNGQEFLAMILKEDEWLCEHSWNGNKEWFKTLCRCVQRAVNCGQHYPDRAVKSQDFYDYEKRHKVCWSTVMPHESQYQELAKLYTEKEVVFSSEFTKGFEDQINRYAYDGLWQQMMTPKVTGAYAYGVLLASELEFMVKEICFSTFIQW